MSLKHCLIVCNGYVNKKLLKHILESYRKKIKIVSADGAANSLYKFNITPDYIIGDLDSIKRKVHKHFTKKKVVIKKIPEQEHTDFEKCILFALSKKFNKIIVLGFAGK
ncbi:MAG: thiamine diphosphokinase [Ignavibacteria bacterium]